MISVDREAASDQVNTKVLARPEDGEGFAFARVPAAFRRLERATCVGNDVILTFLIQL